MNYLSEIANSAFGWVENAKKENGTKNCLDGKENGGKENKHSIQSNITTSKMG